MVNGFMMPAIYVIKGCSNSPGKFNCSSCKKTFRYSMKRYRFVVNIADDTSNASLLLWDREVAILLGKKVSEIVVSSNEIHQSEYIPKEREDILLGQSCLFKLQWRDNFEIPMAYPSTANKVCNLPEIVD